MSRKGITIDNVDGAVAKLRANGELVTTRVVRLELGRGSYGTIAKFLKELSVKSGPTPKALPEVPETLLRQCANAVFSMWQSSSEIASLRNVEIEVQCKQRVHNLTTQLTEARQKGARLEAELNDTATALSACKRSAHMLKEETAMLREELRIQRAVYQRVENDRDIMLKQVAKTVRLAAKSPHDKTPGRKRRRGYSAELPINGDSQRPGA